jgi:hypothetical protein
MIYILSIFCLLSVFIVFLIPKSDIIFAWLIGVMLILYSGLRKGGFDYYEYIIIIDLIQQYQYSYDEKLIQYAKDPIFLLIVLFVTNFNLDDQIVFLICSTISVSSKILATSIMPGRRTMFIALYTVFLAPGLEFAAIRAAMGIGFLMLAFATLHRSRAFFALAAVLSHISMASIWFGRYVFSYRWIAIGLFTLMVYLGSQQGYLGTFIDLEGRAGNYVSDTGTALAVVVPLITLALVFSLRFSRLSIPNKNTIEVARNQRALEIAMLIATLISIPVVTVSFRITEISLVIILFLWLEITQINKSKMLLYFLQSFVWICIVSYLNISRLTWHVLTTLEI